MQFLSACTGIWVVTQKNSVCKVREFQRQNIILHWAVTIRFALENCSNQISLIRKMFHDCCRQIGLLADCTGILCS